jgi:phosphomannomutase
MNDQLEAFRQGDIRGTYPEEINEQFVVDFAHAFVGHFGLNGKIATGRDMRNSSELLQNALNETLASIGIEVVNIGLCPTELGYFASGMPEINAAIVVTASHNPANYNGLKCVLKNGRSIGHDNGLLALKQLMSGGYRHRASRGGLSQVDYHVRYLEFLQGHFSAESLLGGQVALNGLNGTAATIAELISTNFELPVTWFRKSPGPIPKQGADPASPVLAQEMREFMSGSDFSLGVAWDGDCDRCVCFDGSGELIPTYYLVGLLVDHFLRQKPGGAIVFDTKLCWNTLDMINRGGGKAVPAETGHAFMKQKMHQHGAVYGGELSSHHYFGDFYGCDSGMFAWLTVLKLLNHRGESIQALIQERRKEICCTPEITMSLSDEDAAFALVLKTFGDKACEVDYFDGLSFAMPGDWRFSLRRSKTEPVVRINFEARKAGETLIEEGAKVLGLLESFRADDVNWLANFRIQ